MKIGLLQLENYINIAIEKLRIFYLSEGHCVENYNPFNHYDLVCISKIFSFTKNYQLQINADKIDEGGTGLNLKKLPDYIENLKPKINVGFTSRGCVKKCEHCIVPYKEGSFKIVSEDIQDFWDGKSKNITLLDNNILVDEKHFKNIMEQIKKNEITVDFNHGIDILFLDETDDQIISYFKYFKRFIRFACDNFELLPVIRKKIKILIDKGIKPSKLFFYVLVGKNKSDLSDNIYTIQYLRNIGATVFAQAYLPHWVKERKSPIHPIFDELSRWGCISFNRNIPFERYLKYRNNLNLLKDYYNKIY